MALVEHPEPKALVVLTEENVPDVESRSQETEEAERAIRVRRGLRWAPPIAPTTKP